MASISKQNTRISIFPEVTPNTTPDDAAFEVARFSNDAFGASANQVIDPTIVSDRIAAGSQRVGMENRGSLEMVMRDDSVIETLLEGAMGDTWTGDALAVTSEKKTYSIVKHYGASPLYPHLYKGVMVNGFTLTIPDEGLCTISFDLQGGPTPVDEEPPTSVGGPTYTAGAPSTSLGMLSSDAVVTWSGALAGIGTSATGVCVTSLSLTYNNNVEGVKCIGIEGESESNLGQSQIEGTATIFMESSLLYTAFLDQLGFGIDIDLTDGTQTYSFEAVSSRAKLKEYSVPVEGNSGSLIAQVGFDIVGSSGTSLGITRAV